MWPCRGALELISPRPKVFEVE
jgi:hypothetical protein